MSFLKRDVKDRVVQHPKRYRFVPVTGQADTYDLVPVTGTVIEPGTPINKAYLQPIEDTLENVTTELGKKVNEESGKRLMTDAEGSKLAGIPNDVVNAIAMPPINSDPNITTVPFILTNHVNSPNGAFYWYVRTLFYSTKTASRSQIAIRYDATANADEMYIRSYYNPTWTTWKRVWHSANLTKADVGLSQVPNYPMATQVQAEAGLVDTALMSPLRVAQAIAAISPARTYGMVTYSDTIPASGTITKQIPIGANKNNATVGVKESELISFYGGALIFCGKDKAKTYAVGSGESSWASVNSRQFSDAILNGKFGKNATGNSAIHIVDMYISGTNLVIVFRNTDNSAGIPLRCVMTWEAY